jgi:hypothetical protein
VSFVFWLREIRAAGKKPDKVKDKNWKGRDSSECFTALKPMEVSCKRAVA